MSRERGIARKCPAFFSVPAFLTFSPRTGFFSMFEFFAAKREKFPAPWLALDSLHLLFFRSLARRFLKSPRAKHGFFLTVCPALGPLAFLFSRSLAVCFLEKFPLLAPDFFDAPRPLPPLDSAKLFGQARAARSGCGSRAFFWFTAPSPAGGWPTVSQGWLHQPCHRPKIVRCSSAVAPLVV